MSRGRNFVDREVFERIISETARRDGGDYEDIDTIYGDMSRLVVAWLAATPPDELSKHYNTLGWLGNANARAMHEAAKRWMATYRPTQPRQAGVADDPTK